jgi:hypothetical protein
MACQGALTLAFCRTLLNACNVARILALRIRVTLMVINRIFTGVARVNQEI